MNLPTPFNTCAATFVHLPLARPLRPRLLPQLPVLAAPITLPRLTSPTAANDCCSPQQEAAHEVGSAAHDVGSAVKEDATAAKDKMADAASSAGESAKVSARECCTVGGAGRNVRGFMLLPGERMADAASAAGESAKVSWSYGCMGALLPVWALRRPGM